jgi:hypothetical protein
MEGVEAVRQLDDTYVQRHAEVAGRAKEWRAEVTDQRPDERVASRSEGGAGNAGVLSFHQLGEGRLVQPTQSPPARSRWESAVTRRIALPSPGWPKGDRPPPGDPATRRSPADGAGPTCRRLCSVCVSVLVRRVAPPNFVAVANSIMALGRAGSTSRRDLFARAFLVWRMSGYFGPLRIAAS